jgi:Domain of unknown function (DUF5753)
MTSHPGPVVQRTLLIKELRRLRRGVGLTGGEVAETLLWRPSRLARLEDWDGASAADLLVLLQFYDVGPERTEELLSLAAEADAAGWWHEYAPYISDSGFLVYLGYEPSALLINAFECMVVPALLQTEEYAQTVLRGFMPDGSSERLDALVALRMERQRRMAERNASTRCTYLIDEAALRRRVGSPQLMVDQLHRIVQMADDPAVAIAVLPLSVTHAGLSGPFWILEFDGEVDDVLHLEGVPESKTVSGPNPVIVNRRTVFAELCERALNGPRSQDLLRLIATEMP